MRKFKFAGASLAIFLLLPYILAGQTIPGAALKSITPAEMKAHVAYLASDMMRGRNTPSPELDTCAAYIARQFASYGLEPAGKDGSYYQVFYVVRKKLSEPNSFSMKTAAGLKELRLKYDFLPSQETANGSIAGKEVVFAGYGITAPEYGYDDYAGIDAVDRVVLVFEDEPQKDDESSVFNGMKATDHSKIRVKVENAIDHGAVGIILAPDPNTIFRRPPNHWPSLIANASADAVPLTIDSEVGKKVVTVVIGKKITEELLAFSGKKPKEIIQQIDADLKPDSFILPGLTVTMETNLAGEKYSTQNVAGYWEGSDPKLKDDLVIIGAHYDHVGVMSDTIVYNGADDNASGTAGVMEIAEAFTQAGIRPRRSILFIAFAGEEKGLFGSRYYTENPLFPLKHTVAMLNLDMISRNDSNEVAIIGAPTSNTLREINDEANQKTVHMKLGFDQEQYFMQSDHYSFYRKSIPVLFYNTRDTPDLHQPTDDVEKIIPEKMAKIGKLVFTTAWLLANRDITPDFIKVR